MAPLYLVPNPRNTHLDAGAEAHQGVRDVGGGKLIAAASFADGNIIGLLPGQRAAEAGYGRTDTVTMCPPRQTKEPS